MLRQDWCNAGGIVGRGVLLDYVGYLEAKGLEVPEPTRFHNITVAELDKVAEYQGVKWKVGDILFVRSGFVRWYNSASNDERVKKVSGEDASFIGLKTDDTSRAWLWNHHFSAVAGDTLAFEGQKILPLLAYNICI